MHEKIQLQVATYCGAGISAASGWLIENHVLLGSIGIVIGICVGIGGLVAQNVWAHKQYKLLKKKTEFDLKEKESQESEQYD